MSCFCRLFLSLRIFDVRRTLGLYFEVQTFRKALLFPLVGLHFPMYLNGVLAESRAVTKPPKKLLG